LTDCRPLKGLKSRVVATIREHLAARDQVRRLPHARAAGRPQDATADPDRTRLDRQIWIHIGSPSRSAGAAYVDGELCALRPDGVPAFSRLQAAMDEGRTDDLVFIVFDLLYLNGKSTAALPLIERKELLRALFKRQFRGLRFSDHVIGNGPRFREQACQMGVEGVVSKRVDGPYAPGDRRFWLKSKCLNREEFIVIGWSEPSGSRSHFGALLLGYYSDDGKLHYAGRAGTGFTEMELKRLAGVLRPLETRQMPLDKPPPRETRFGSPLELSRVHWAAGSGRGGDIPDLDRGRPSAGGLLSGTA
jgi:ATP-dependent DNA ligase